MGEKMKEPFWHQNAKVIGHNIPWEEVFEYWRCNEATDENMNKAFSLGYLRWAPWRVEKYVIPLDCRNANWNLFNVEKPLEVKSLYAGPIQPWIDTYYGNKSIRSFFIFSQQLL
jgi:hypothetical protein